MNVSINVRRRKMPCLDETLSTIDDDNEMKHERIRELEAEVVELEREKAKLVEVNADLMAQLEDVKCEECEGLDNYYNSQLQLNAETLKNSVYAVEHELEAKDQIIAEFQRKQEEVDKEKETLKNRVIELDKTVNDMKNEQETASEEKKALETQLATMKNQYEDQLRLFAEEKKALEDRLIEMNGTSSDKKQEEYQLRASDQHATMPTPVNIELKQQVVAADCPPFVQEEEQPIIEVHTETNHYPASNYTINDVNLSNQDLSKNDFDMLAAGGTIHYLSLDLVRICDKRNVLVPFEDIISKVPNIVKLKL